MSKWHICNLLKRTKIDSSILVIATIFLTYSNSVSILAKDLTCLKVFIPYGMSN